MDTPKGAVPNTPLGRRKRIVQLLATQSIRSQSHLKELLNDEGIDVTQATLSRDLEDLGAVKIRSDAGEPIYVIPQVDDFADNLRSGTAATERLARACEDLLLSAEAINNMIVVHTPTAAAQYLASAIDRAALDGVAGTISGDDTLLVIARGNDDAHHVAETLIAVANGNSVR